MSGNNYSSLEEKLRAHFQALFINNDDLFRNSPHSPDILIDINNLDNLQAQLAPLLGVVLQSLYEASEEYKQQPTSPLSPKLQAAIDQNNFAEFTRILLNDAATHAQHHNLPPTARGLLLGTLNAMLVGDPVAQSGQWADERAVRSGLTHIIESLDLLDLGTAVAFKNPALRTLAKTLGKGILDSKISQFKADLLDFIDREINAHKDPETLKVNWPAFFARLQEQPLSIGRFNLNLTDLMQQQLAGLADNLNQSGGGLIQATADDTGMNIRLDVNQAVNQAVEDLLQAANSIRQIDEAGEYHTSNVTPATRIMNDRGFITLNIEGENGATFANRLAKEIKKLSNPISEVGDDIFHAAVKSESPAMARLGKDLANDTEELSLAAQKLVKNLISNWMGVSNENTRGMIEDALELVDLSKHIHVTERNSSFTVSIDLAGVKQSLFEALDTSLSTAVEPQLAGATFTRDPDSYSFRTHITPAQLLEIAGGNLAVLQAFVTATPDTQLASIGRAIPAYSMHQKHEAVKDQNPDNMFLPILSMLADGSSTSMGLATIATLLLAGEAEKLDHQQGILGVMQQLLAPLVEEGLRADIATEPTEVLSATSLAQENQTQVNEVINRAFYLLTGKNLGINITPIFDKISALASQELDNATYRASDGTMAQNAQAEATHASTKGNAIDSLQSDLEAGLTLGGIPEPKNTTLTK